MKQIELDVSELAAPEPFQKIMSQLPLIEVGTVLKVVHRKKPLMLYKPLDDLGFNCHVQKGTAKPFEIFIWRKEQASPTNLKQPNLAQSEATPSNCADC